MSQNNPFSREPSFLQAVEEEVSRRLSDRKAMRDEVVEMLKPEFAAIREEIGESNHIKQMFEREFAAVRQGIIDTNNALTQHALMTGHAGSMEVVRQQDAAIKRFTELGQQLGVNDLSLEEKKAFPKVLRDAIYGERSHSRRAQLWNVAGHFASATGAAVTAVSGMFLILKYTGVIH